jgi:hypothetical protein
MSALLACLFALPAPAPADGAQGSIGRSRLARIQTSAPPVSTAAGPQLLAAADPITPAGITCAYEDWGDAPEEVPAYVAVSGHFPTCGFDTPAGTQNLVPGCPAISSAPGLTGYVRHIVAGTETRIFWLGCGDPAAGTTGVDSETDGKMNATGAATSVCNPNVPIDCTQAAWLTFGQDECCGDGVDAGVDPCNLNFATCQNATVSFKTYNCRTTTQAYLNILIDMNQDGDWNDNFQCPGPTLLCAYEWAVKNAVVTLAPGCEAHVSPSFLMGPNAGHSWMRVTITGAPVPDDFPWNGSRTANADGSFHAGETEDYPVEIGQHCPEYNDRGDAPEEFQAYPGVPGHFPTCTTITPAGTQNIVPLCPPISTAPGPTGYVLHVATAADPFSFWLGCGTPGVDGETDGKSNDNGAPFSLCNTGVPVDCFETNFGLTFGQDECYGDGVDAGLDLGKVKLSTCQTATIDYKAYNCKTTIEVYLNILIDMNHDGDWNDNFQCPGVSPGCAYEWAVKNKLITLAPGCNPLTSPSFLVGPQPGDGWLRITLTATPVSDNFPWDGSAGGPGGQGFFQGGETEDYPVVINGPCDIGYEDFGDAPEDIVAYTTGVVGHFPTCLFGGVPGTQEIDCGTPLSTPPATTGYVKHVAAKTDADHFWLGCPIGAVDSEADGKVNVGPPAVVPSACDPAVAVDCYEGLGGLIFGQDECYGDPDAGIPSFVSFGRCSTQAVRFDAYNCSDHVVTAYLNVLVDWNQDGDWNDNPICFQGKICAPEWAVKNATVTLVPGCNGLVTPNIQVGPREGFAWMRITLSGDPALPDYPWNGSVSLAGSAFKGGETEDYPVRITPSLVSVDEGRDPSRLWLAPIVPNPALNGIALRFVLPRDADVSLAAYDLAGRRLKLIASGHMPAGERRATWDFRDESGAPISAGYYVVKLRAGDRVVMQRGIRVR